MKIFFKIDGKEIDENTNLSGLQEMFNTGIAEIIMRKIAELPLEIQKPVLYGVIEELSRKDDINNAV